MTDRPCFHLAIPVDDIEAARAFYGGVLGLTRGRSDTQWTDWNFYGHQVVTHETGSGPSRPAGHNPVDGQQVPVPHFGLVLDHADFHDLAEKMQAPQPAKIYPSDRSMLSRVSPPVPVCKNPRLLLLWMYVPG